MIFNSIAALFGTILAVIMTMILIGAIYANRAALPMVGAMFVAILIFGAIW